MVQENIVTSPLDPGFDKEKYAARDKQRVVEQQGRGALFSSVTQIATFMAGILTAGAMGLLVPALKELGKFSLAGLMEASPVGVAFLGAAAASTVVAVGANIAAQRFSANAWFDQAEANARHNAKYIVRELAKAQAANVQPEYPQNERADGKQWANVVQARSAQQEITAAEMHR